MDRKERGPTTDGAAPGGRNSRFRFRLLGSLQVHRGECKIPVTAAKQRSLIAALLLRANRPVSIDELAQSAWSDDVPRRMVSALRVYVMRLRQLLGEPRLIDTTSTGYVLRIPDQDLDLGRFESLAAQGLAASASGELDAAEASFDQALAEWRGPALADVESEFLHRVDVPQLHDRKLDIEAARNDVVLRKGGHRGLIAPLRQLTEQYPFREQISAQLMLALYRSGRRTEAMNAYGAVRGLLADRLGIDPGQEVESLYSAILSRDPALDFTAEARNASPVATPSQVAPVVPDFVGRAAEADVIGELLGARDTDTAMPVVTLCGPPGVGKTSLAAFVARQLRTRFPDGQLFADLRPG
ncbi:BTAD domain-containing putative transcriptional regulator [Streptomyces sp. LZ34]